MNPKIFGSLGSLAASQLFLLCCFGLHLGIVVSQPGLRAMTKGGSLKAADDHREEGGLEAKRRRTEDGIETTGVTRSDVVPCSLEPSKEGGAEGDLREGGGKAGQCKSNEKEASFDGVDISRWRSPTPPEQLLKNCASPAPVACIPAHFPPETEVEICITVALSWTRQSNMQTGRSSLPVLHLLALGSYHVTAVLCVAAVHRMKLPLGGINMTRIQEPDQREPPDTLLKVRSALVCAPREFNNKS